LLRTNREDQAVWASLRGTLPGSAFHGLAYGSQPNAQDNGEINHRLGGRGVYFRDPNGHSFELLTVV